MKRTTSAGRKTIAVHLASKRIPRASPEQRSEISGSALAEPKPYVYKNVPRIQDKPIRVAIKTVTRNSILFCIVCQILCRTSLITSFTVTSAPLPPIVAQSTSPINEIFSGFVSTQIPTQGRAKAAAKCINPVSTPMPILACATTAATAGIGMRGRT